MKNKPQKFEQIHISLPIAAKKHAKKKASELSLSISSYLRMLILKSNSFKELTDQIRNEE